MDTLTDTKPVDIITALRDALQVEAAPDAAIETPITDILKARRFNPDITPPKLRPIFSLAGQVISTPGNLTTITAQIKTGKSAVIGAMLASVMADREDVDCLGFTSSGNPKGYALLHFDSEQSPDDHWHQVRRSLKRARLIESPPWFYSYCLTGLGCVRAWEAVKEATRQAVETHGGILAELIDGWADLVNDVNDPAESNAFVAESQDMAIQRDCPIIGVIHFNPGGDKVRGHLGSQLERKAETNLRLDKDESEVTCIWSNKQRRAPIPKGTGPCFQWSDEAEMHVSTETRQAAKDEEERERLTLLADEIFGEQPSMRYSELTATVKTRQKITERTAERRVSRMAKLKIIRKSGAGLWAKAT